MYSTCKERIFINTTYNTGSINISAVNVSNPGNGYSMQWHLWNKSKTTK
ncbi:MAG: hypothetical protein ACLRPW_04665 [Intestinibacter sp.]